jgi:hypothetical protein
MSASAVMHPSVEHMYVDEFRYREASADPTTVPSYSEKASPRRILVRCPTQSAACTDPTPGFAGSGDWPRGLGDRTAVFDEDRL